MGTGIAMAVANAGFPVFVDDAAPGAMERGRASVERTYARAVERGKLDEAERAARLARVAWGASDAVLAQVDLAIEAAFEDLATKRDVFARLGAVCRPDAILATNTS